MELPFFIVMILIGVAVVAIGVTQNAARIKKWQEIAARLGLQADSDNIYGQIDEVALRVWTEMRGSGKSRQTFTIFSASLDGDVPVGLSLVREGLLRRIGKIVGMEDIQLDLPGIDEHLMVRATDPDDVRRWAGRADVSRGLMDLIELNVSFEVTSTEIQLDFTGAMADADRIEFLLEKLVQIARALSGKGYGALIDDGHW